MEEARGQVARSAPGLLAVVLLAVNINLGIECRQERARTGSMKEYLERRRSALK